MPLSDCITVDDVKNFTVECQPLDLCCDDSTIETELEIAYAAVSIITGTDWCPQLQCITFNGSGTNKLFLHPRTSQPLLTVTSITDTACCGGSADLDDAVNHGIFLELPCANNTGDSCFPCGENNISVCGTWGKPMPAAIKKAVIVLTIESLSPGSSGQVSDPYVKSATWEDFRVSYQNNDTAENVLTTGYQEIDDMLKLYTNTVNDIHLIVVPQDDACTYRECGVAKSKPCCSKGNCGGC